ncbi:hypothetical protein [Pseudonocardia humida]|uniref:Uncharacterized protein n=1 Tax=Pseudonocardia humida TaxID=2800819 RepID=A0ABT0ZYH3_9PSEU|nr:hypothetical protein [Pseudonocardia humida]MCO1655786.1 hypothetical protein [Pseudonocardia humida]
MSAPARGHGSELTAVTDRLVIEFADVMPRGVVEAEVAAADRELRGQVPTGAMAEMLHRLVVTRLVDRDLTPQG